MKKLNFTVFLIVFTHLLLAQDNNVKTGEAFLYDNELEEDSRICFADGYNFYLHSIINEWSGLCNRKIIVRKFDQANNLIDQKEQNFSVSADMVHSYKSSYQINSDQIVTLIQSSSKKQLKSDIYLYTFDKKNDAFTSKVITSYPIESVSKSGDLQTSMSPNGKYLTVLYAHKVIKKQPQKVDCIVYEAATMKEVFNRSITFEDNYTTLSCTTTDSGKIVIVRNPNSYKDYKYLTVIDDNNQENKYFEPKMVLHHPKPLTINNEDYILAFNFEDKTVRTSGDFSNLMLYNITTGKVINNDVVNMDNKVQSKLLDVKFRHVAIENNKLFVFTEILRELPKPTTSSKLAQMQVADESIYGPGNILEMDLAGKLTTNKEIKYSDSYFKSSHYYAVVPVNGQFYLSGPDKLLNPFENLSEDQNFKPNQAYTHVGNRFPQTTCYVASTNTMIFSRVLRISNTNKMIFISVQP